MLDIILIAIGIFLLWKNLLYKFKIKFYEQFINNHKEKFTKDEQISIESIMKKMSMLK